MSYTFGDGCPYHWLGTTVEQYSTAHDQNQGKSYRFNCLVIIIIHTLKYYYS